jgi:hypothetical protein
MLTEIRPIGKPALPFYDASEYIWRIVMKTVVATVS